MANEILIFDAAGSNVDGTDPGSPLTVGPGTSYRLREGTSFPGAPLDVMYASSVDTEGELPASRRYGNRSLTIRLGMIDTAGTLLAALQAKFAKLQAEGGTLKRTLKNGDVRIYDIVAADGWGPNYDWAYWRSDFSEVAMTLPARPLSRGAKVTFSGHTATTKQPVVFTETTVAGDVTALGSLVLANATNTKRWGIWGLQSRYYDASATAALFIEAEDCVAVTAAANAGSAGASGGGVNKVMRHSNVGTGIPDSFSIGTGGVENTNHIGAFRVFARVQALSTNTGIMSIWVSWAPRRNQTKVDNDAVRVVSSAGAAINGSWVLADLGQVTLPKARAGTQGWAATFKSSSTVTTDDIDWDWIMLVPVDEGSGVITHEDGVVSTGSVEFAHDAVQGKTSGAFWYDPQKYEGDLIRVPPAGLEARTVRVVTLLAGDTSPGNLTDTVIDAGNLDAITATLAYWPRYLT